MSERVRAGVRWAYAGPAFALAVVGIPVYVFLPKFYSDVIGVDVAVVGALLLGLRLFDAVTDPLIGRASDRLHTRFGRRRPWIFLAAWPLALSVYLLFAPPALSPDASALWLGAGLFALFLFWTAVTVPYESLGAEITSDYDARTSLLGLRDGVLIAGTLVAAVSTALIGAAFGLPDDADGQRARFARFAWIYAPLLILLCGTCAALVAERPSTAPRPGGLDLRGMLRNRPFTVLLASYTISAFGSNLPATLILYYVQYVLQADNAEAFLLLYLATGVLFLPAWVALARRSGKKAAWLGSMAINTGAFSGVFLLGPGDVEAYGVLVVLSGVGFGATLAIPSAMQADVIDYDELHSGQRREGQYIGVWSVARKLAAALGVGVALTVLGAAGYQPNVEQTPQVQWTLRALYALVPSACNLIGLLIALAYPISRERHGEILDAIALRRRGERVVDPLRPGAAIP